MLDEKENDKKFIWRNVRTMINDEEYRVYSILRMGDLEAQKQLARSAATYYNIEIPDFDVCDDPLSVAQSFMCAHANRFFDGNIHSFIPALILWPFIRGLIEEGEQKNNRRLKSFCYNLGSILGLQQYKDYV